MLFVVRRATPGGCLLRRELIAAAGKDRFRSGKLPVNRCLGLSQVTLTDAYTVECIHIAPLKIGLGFGAEIIAEVLPVIAPLIIGAQSAAGVVSTMDHAVLAPRIACDAIDDAVLLPIHL